MSAATEPMLGPHGPLSDLELETLWPEVPADARPGDDGLISELSVPQRLALPAAFHRPVWDDLGRPSLFHCAVCWGDGWTTQWPCAAAAKEGGSVVLDPKGVAEARGAGRAEGAAAEGSNWVDELGALIDTERVAIVYDDTEPADYVSVQDLTGLMERLDPEATGS